MSIRLSSRLRPSLFLVIGVVVLSLAAARGPSARAATVSMTGLHVVGNQIENGGGQTVRLLGVDRSGAEYACIQGWGIFDGPSDATSVQAMASWHINAVRVPLNEDCWLNINGSPSAYSGATYQTAIGDYVNTLNAAGLAVILDLHWNAAGTAQATGQQPMADRDHAPAFWTSVANYFKGNTSVIFDLYNEPYPDNNQDTTAAWTCWKNGGTCSGVSYQAAGMQELVNAVRATGAANLIIAGGVTYAGSLSQWLTYRPSDSLNNTAASFHNYNFGGCTTSTCWSSNYGPVAQQVPIVAGEIGENDCASGYINGLMTWLDNHAASYLGWTWDAWDCSSGPALISDYNGTPTNFGLGYQQHLAALAAASPTPTFTPAPPTATNTPAPPTATSTVTNTPAPPTATGTATQTATATPTSTPTPLTLGLTSAGVSTDKGDANHLAAARVTTGNAAVTLQSISAYVGKVDGAPSNKYSLAIYTNSGGTPGSLLAQSVAGTLTANHWNTLSVAASLSASTSYWLVYNTNAGHTTSNELTYNSAGTPLAARSSASVTFGIWPATFGAATISNRQYALYATVH